MVNKMETKRIDIGLFVLRLAIGLMMLLHGISKLVNGIGPIVGMLESSGLPGFIAYGVLVGEVVAPLMLIVGFRTRLAGAIFAFNMVVAVSMAHLGDIFTLVPMGGWALELQGAYFFGGVVLAITGAGGIAASTKNRFD